MAISKGISSSQVSEITECVICTESFKEPKVLPCIHTFCLHCLETYGKNNKPGDKIKCPLCRKEFAVPHGGFKELPNNYFIIQLMQLDQSLGSELREHDVICDLCSELGEKPPAAVYCIECEQHLCQPCRTRHNKQKSSKGHTVLSLKDKPSAEQLKKMAASCCEKHPNKVIEFYCYDCKMIACYACFVESHNRHKCSDVKKAGEELRRTMIKNVENVTHCISTNREEKKQIEQKKRSLVINVTAAQKKIEKKYDELKALLDSHRDQLNAELHSLKANMLKELETREEEVERQSVILESFRRYCEEMKEKGTPCDISRNANALLARADELVKAQNDAGPIQLSPVDIMFTPTPTAVENKNMIGKLVFKVEDIDQKSAQVKKLKFSSTTFLDKNLLVEVIPGKGQVCGVAVIDTKVFVARSGVLQCFVEVYDANNLIATPHLLKISEKPLNCPRLAACSHCYCLYVSHWSCDKESVIYRVELSNSSVCNWMVKRNCEGLSVTKNYNLLVTLCLEQRVQEFTTYGSLIREIRLHSSIDNPHHSVQLSDGNFIVCHKGSKQHRICIVDASGRILKSYGGSRGSSVDQLNWPYHLSVDSSDHVFVADYFNRRVLLLSPTLTLLGTVQTPGQRMNYPCCLHIDTINDRLLIGEEWNILIVSVVGKKK